MNSHSESFITSQGRMSPSNLHNGSWSTGSLLSGSRSSSNDSSRVSSQVSSPSSAPSSGYQDAWETLYAAAGEIVRLKMSEEDVEKSYQSRVGNPTMRAHLPQQTRPAGQTAGRNLPLYARRKDWSSMSNNYVMARNLDICAIELLMVLNQIIERDMVDVGGTCSMFLGQPMSCSESLCLTRDGLNRLVWNIPRHPIS